MYDIENMPDGEVCQLFQGWLKVILHNAAVNYCRSREKRKKLLAPTPSNGDLYAMEPFDYIAKLLSQSGFYFESEEYQQAIDRLPSNQRLILELIYVYRYSIKTAAEEAEYSLSSAYRIHQDAINSLREQLVKEDSGV